MAGEFTDLPDSRASVCLLDWKVWSLLGIQGLFLLLKLMKMAKELKICTTESLEFIYCTIQVSLRYYKWLRSLGQLAQRTQSMATLPLWHLQWLGEGQTENKSVKQKMLGGALSFETSLEDGLPPTPTSVLEVFSLCVVLISWCSCNSAAQRAPQQGCQVHKAQLAYRTILASWIVGIMPAVPIWQLTYSLFHNKGNSNFVCISNTSTTWSSLFSKHTLENKLYSVIVGIAVGIRNQTFWKPAFEKLHWYVDPPSIICTEN